VVPLRFGDHTIGLMELDTHKRGSYGVKESVLIRRVANQLATTIHILDLRNPLLETVDRLSRELATLTTSARTLRRRRRGVARTAGEIGRAVVEEGSSSRADRVHVRASMPARPRDRAGCARVRTTPRARRAPSPRSIVGTVDTAMERLVGASGSSPKGRTACGRSRRPRPRR
jgi:hypothetical protein